ncbi:MAG: hypothetical protein ICV73_30950, partial [Acetobacteraceae bacterium]|nr:hypothetical protein [Acetobacteraceae bacterium]
MSAERLVDAPADVVYRCIADYREHHRPGRFLPAVFSDFRVERGGVGAETVISFTLTLGGRPGPPGGVPRRGARLNVTRAIKAAPANIDRPR